MTGTLETRPLPPELDADPEKNLNETLAEVFIDIEASGSGATDATDAIGGAYEFLVTVYASNAGRPDVESP